MTAKHLSFIERLILEKRIIYFGFPILGIILFIFPTWYFFAVDIKNSKWNDPLFMSVFITLIVVTFIYGGFKKYINKIDKINDKNRTSLEAAEAGLSGEKCVEAELKRIFNGSVHKIYNDLELIIEGRKFDIDCVIISPKKGVIVLEIKDWPGKTVFYGDCVERIHTDGKQEKKWGKKDPRKQLKNNARDLESYLYVYGLRKIHISKAVVIVDGESTFMECGGIYIINKIGDLKKYTDSLYGKNLTPDSYQKLIKAMDKLREGIF